MGPEELAATVRLPPELAEKPHLREFYGCAAWAARGCFSGEVGWFDGNPTNLFPLHPAERAALLAESMGGAEKIFGLAETALFENRPQWAAELCDILLRLEFRPKKTRQVKAKALAALAEAQINACARNYYFSEAKKLRED